MRPRRQGGRKHERREGISLSWRRDTQPSAVTLTCAATLCTIHIAVHQAARFQPRNKLTTVILKPDEPVEVALRRFRRAIERTGLIPELRARTAYEKPTAERKRQKAAAVARLRKQIKRSLPPKKQY